MRLPLTAVVAALLLTASPADASPGVWSVDKVEGGQLVFAYSQEGDAWLTLTCGRGGRMHLSSQLWRSEPSQSQIEAATKVAHYEVMGVVELRAGGLTWRLPADMTINQEAGVWVADVRLPATDPLLAAFARTGSLQLSSHGDTESYKLGTADRTRLTRFLTACK